MTKETISNAWVRGIADGLQTVGLNPCEIFTDAGMSLTDLNNPDGRVTSETVSALWELAEKRSGNPAIGLAMAQIARPASFDAVAYVMMSCPNLLAGLEHLIRYLLIVSNSARIGLVKEHDGVWVTVELLGGTRPVPTQRIDFVVVTILNFCRWITGADLRPLAAEFAEPVPVDTKAYADAFKCPLHFNAPVHRLLFSHADLALPLPTSNPVLAEVHGRYAAEHLHRLANESISFKTRELIVSRLAEGEPLRGKIAKALCLSERTLQRRLHDEGTSFHELVDQARSELAEQYLYQPHVPLSQITYLLGFGDQSTFSRACKRWFNLSPGEYRCAHAKNGRLGAAK